MTLEGGVVLVRKARRALSCAKTTKAARRAILRVFKAHGNHPASVDLVFTAHFRSACVGLCRGDGYPVVYEFDIFIERRKTHRPGTTPPKFQGRHGRRLVDELRRGKPLRPRGR